MMEKMIFGRYIPADSIAHRMDPRAKLIFVFAFIAIIFIANDVWGYVVAAAFTYASIKLSGLSLRFLMSGLKPVMILIAFTFLLQLFFAREGNIVFELGFIRIYEEGIRQAFFISMRFTLLVFMTSLLTLTTTPISITDGLESLLNPLKKIRFPAHELALMMSIALRFIPTLMDETDKIMKAQMARGSDMSSGPLKDRIKAIVPLMIPLFVNAFKRAEDLATAMEVRGYRGGEGRTKYRLLFWKARDTFALLSLVLLAAALAAFRFWI
ncbi:energy-coupling factor transporter transmembrane component T family protein [Jeotgalibacillus haloalkalitolerans]|uniref:Energy-coupling factor transporter transmembrane protein EcfT n=1 Tax=Jeotgalibacillus haloalkalitolerans TaxID=3104292 RepID=A0ABU5KRA2_9BACL|nr:energy-coupling factor transporter transmembrane protein EcfT [Jeotgalibacillus sp. HH7-29]MDZ5713695.1 energy-coupling factor transporter transmembrane protein EcfT [Jeotgalibacillus sp. HH7-29]